MCEAHAKKDSSTKIAWQVISHCTQHYEDSAP
jgi:hypothetical protein